MKSVKQILGNKQNQIISVAPSTSVYEALEVMMEKNISALLVMKDKTLLGIFTERDYARKIILQGKASKDTAIEEVMTRDLLSVSLSDSLEYCMTVITENHIRHLPVVENNEVHGLVSIGDVVKNIIEVQKATIEQLENYINS